MIKEEFYQNIVINDILFNNASHMVSVFKEHLIFDDACEFLHQFVGLK
jgi:hypothetical protein